MPNISKFFTPHHLFSQNSHENNNKTGISTRTTIIALPFANANSRHQTQRVAAKTLWCHPRCAFVMELLIGYSNALIFASRFSLLIEPTLRSTIFPSLKNRIVGIFLML